MRTHSINRRAKDQQLPETGFTLIELLIVITIIITLAGLTMVGVNHMKFGAAKATTTSQMRQVAVAVTMWGTEKNNGEPFYVANGTGDYCDESYPGTNPSLAPGNPAKILYNTETPGEGYCTDYLQFFSALVNLTPPVRDKYKPESASPEGPWGAFVWYYPFSTKMTPKQQSASGQYLGSLRVAPNLENKLMMMTDYSKGTAKWDNFYLALMVDGSVRELVGREIPVRPQQ